MAAGKKMDNWNDSAPFPGHDEGTNRPPNVQADRVFISSGSTFAPLDQSGSNGLNQKTGFGTNGRADNQE